MADGITIDVVEKKTWKLRQGNAGIRIEHHDCSKPIEEQYVTINVSETICERGMTTTHPSEIKLSAEQARKLCKLLLTSLPKAKVYRGRHGLIVRLLPDGSEDQ